MTDQRHDILSIADLSPEVLHTIVEAGLRLKRTPRSSVLAGQTLALIFEKPSLRTRVSFELAMQELGGSCIVLRPDEIQMGRREAIKDIAAYLSRNVTLAALRVFAHATLEEFAAAASIPVINALSDHEHPCQALADLMTVREYKGRLTGVRFAYVGDGNNVCHSLLLAGASTGMHMTVACPEGYEPDCSVVTHAAQLAAKHGGVIRVVHDPLAAVQGAEVLYTDVWASMGQEAEQEIRRAVFAPFQLNRRVLTAAAPDAIVLHCLPAHRGEEITDDVLDSPQSVVFEQAENRRHVQKAAILYAVGRLTAESLSVVS
ncbi:MAG: ornithine carbamoyltransferase [bacterium]|nr:ornithine carbamoyltransferase [bacterium]